VPSSTSVALAGILLAASAVRLAWIAVSEWQPLPDDDAFRYHWFAENLAAGHGFIHLNSEPTAFWPPGYPLLLAALYKLFGVNALWGQLMNVALAVGVVGLTYVLARYTLTESAGLVAAGIVALFPSLVLFTAVTVSETTFTFLALLALSILMLEQNRKRPHPLLLVLAGLITGYTALTRGQAVFLPVVAVPFWYLASRNLRTTAFRFAVVTVITLLTVVPWTVRNALQMNAFVPVSTNAGVDLWIGHHDGASGKGQFADELVYGRPDLEPVAGEVWANDEGFRRATEFALQEPLQEIRLPVLKLFYLYQNDEEGLRWNDGHGEQPWMGHTLWMRLRAVSNGYYYVVMAFGLLGGALLQLRLHKPQVLLIVSLILYWTAVHLVFFGDPRFHAPVMPLVAICAAAALTWLWDRPGSPPLRYPRTPPASS
jgi:4-amino-4-deoxy-L-arabinose transferase-like glycosyltransferase